MPKNTHQHLVYELIKLNKNGAYNGIIEKCIACYYHDHKSPIAFPKNQLVIDLFGHKKLHTLCNDVIDGVYNEAITDKDISNAAFAQQMLETGADEKIIEKFLQFKI